MSVDVIDRVEVAVRAPGRQRDGVRETTRDLVEEVHRRRHRVVDGHVQCLPYQLHRYTGPPWPTVRVAERSMSVNLGRPANAMVCTSSVPTIRSTSVTPSAP